MAPTSRRDRSPLSQVLVEEAHRFDFFQAVRMLDRIAWEESPEEPRRRRRPVGRDHNPGQEVVRFRAMPSQSFPTGSIDRITPPKRPPGDAGHPPPLEMTVAFMGLTGPNGVLPEHYTTLLIERIRERDFSLRDFLDLFNHRTISLFYRAWEKYRFPIAYERATLWNLGGRDDLFTWCLYCLIGLGTDGLCARMTVDDEAFLFYAGHFARHPRSAVALERMLADYFALPADVRQFQGQWLYLSRDDQSAMPSRQFPQGLNCHLGADVVIGERVWNVQSKFRVRLGPLTYREFRRFFPTGDYLRPLCQLVRTYVGPEFDFDVQPVLARTEVPWCVLGGDGADASRLGWNTWVRSGPLDRDAQDALFSLEGLPWSPST